MDDEIKPEDLQVEAEETEETEETSETAETEQTEETAAEVETEDAEETVAEEPTPDVAAEALAEIANVRADLAALVEMVNNGFNSLNALFVEGGGVVREFEDNTEEEQNEMIALEDMDFNI